MCDTSPDKWKLLDSGWAKVLLVCATIVGSCYFHVNNHEVHHTVSELMQIFPTRAEFEDSKSSAREDMNWIKSELVRINSKLDRIAERSVK